MKIRIAIILLIVIAAACSKDKFNSKPSLKLKETRGNYIPYDPDGTTNYSVQFVLEYTDAEGDIAGLPLAIRKISSSAPDDACPFNTGKEPFFTDSTSYLLPDVPPSQNQKGEIVVTISNQYDLVKPISCDRLDTLEEATYKFWFKDKAGNVSDTVTAGPITIQKPG
ncbi:MAG: hypothetical protein QM768_20720 [Agriterribacter sp.]